MPYGQPATWTIDYNDDHGFGCGAGTAFCSATMYEYDADGVQRWRGHCGDPTTPEKEQCSISAIPRYATGNILTHPTSTKYEVCEGVDVACSTKTVSWPPFPVDLTLAGVPDGTGSVRAKVSNGALGLRGAVRLFDAVQGVEVPGGWEQDGSAYWNLTGCPGPYFRATLSVGGSYSEVETRTTEIVRINGISSGGQACFDDPPSGSDGPEDGALSDAENAGGYNPSEGCCSVQGRAADPVNTATGAFFEHFEDLSIAGRGPALDLTRDYDSGVATRDSPFGYGWTFSYGMRLSEGAGGLVTIVQENGSEITFEPNGTSYVAPHRVQATLVKNGDGSWKMVRKSRVTFGFSSLGKLTSIRDLNGYSTTVSYPSATSIKVTDSAGRSFTFTLTGSRITSVTDSSSPARSLSYGYDGAGNLTSVVDPAGGTTTYGYNGSHQMTTMRRPKNHGNVSTIPLPVTSNAYDSLGRVVTQTDPLGRVTTFDYATGSTTITDPRGHKTIDRYDAFRLLTSRTVGAGTAAAQKTTYEYDPATLNRTLVCVGGRSCTQNRWDSRGNLIKTTNRVGKITTYTYDALGDQTSVTTPLGITTTKTYSATGNLLTISRPLTDFDGTTTATQKTTFTYGGSPGDVTAMVDPKGNTWKFTYDSYGNKTSSSAPGTAENAAGNKTTWAWNTGRGVPTSMTKPLGNLTGATASTYTTTYAYDQLNRLTTTTNPGWSSSTPTLRRTTVTYDGDGNQTSVRGPDGQLETTVYDAADQRTQVVRADGSTMSYAYWTDGRLRSRTTKLGSVTSYEYDAAGNRVSSTDPLGRLTCVTYDAAGLRSATWHRPASAGACGARPGDHYTAYTRDGEGRPTAIDYGNGIDVQKIVYDADGRKTQTVANYGTTDWTYDSLGRITEKNPAIGSRQSFTYDLADNATAIKVSRSITKRSFDPAGRLIGVTDYKNRAFAFTYDANSNLKTTKYPSASGNQDTYIYEAATDQLTQAKVSRSGTALATFSYTRDSAGRVSTATTTGPTDQAQSNAYTASGQLARSGPSGAGYINAYDGDEQLTSMPTHSNAASTQRYDAAGELCWSTATANAPGSCVNPPSGATSYAYDMAGNRTAATLGSGTTTSYSYNDARQLTTVTDNSGQPIASYTYDTEGLRARKTDANADTGYSWDTSTTGVPALLSDDRWNYVYGPGGRPIEQIDAETGAPTYLHTDQLGSVRYLTNATGAYAGQAAFNAYGKPYYLAGQASPLGYAGQLTDTDTGLVYMRARMYDPATGQFTSVDPLVDLTEQPYAYAGGDPANYTDPTGRAAAAIPGVGPIAVGVPARAAAIRVGTAAQGAMTATAAAFVALEGVGGQGPCNVGPARGSSEAIGGASATAALAAAGMTAEEISEKLGELPDGRSKKSKVKVVDTEDDLNELFDDLTQGGTSTGGSYPGLEVDLPDGTWIGMRNESLSGGPTIDVRLPDGTSFKVHIR